MATDNFAIEFSKTWMFIIFLEIDSSRRRVRVQAEGESQTGKQSESHVWGVDEGKWDYKETPRGDKKLPC